MKTVLMLMAFYDCRPIVPVAEVCRNFFYPLTSTVFLRKVTAGEIDLPLFQMEKHRNGTKFVHVTDLAAYIDRQRDGSSREQVRAQLSEKIEDVGAKKAPQWATEQTVETKLQALYLRPKRVTEIYGVSRDTIYKAAERGDITIYKPGGRPGMSVLKVAEIETWMAGRSQPTESQDPT